MGRNKMAMKTQPCQYRREPAGTKRSTATKMTEMRLRRMSRVLRLRGVDISFDVYGERQGESSRKRRMEFATGSGSRKAAEPGGKIKRGAAVEMRRVAQHDN